MYGFVKQSGGHLKIYSEVDQGTTMKIYLPRLTGRGDDEIEEPEVLGEGHAGEAILVVEDDHDVRAYIAETLRDLGYGVMGAANGEMALKLLSQKDTRIDLMLTDIVMPGMNGRELAGRAQRIRPEMPVLYMTGYSRNAVVHQGRLDEGVELLHKPVTQAELAERVRKMLDQQSCSGSGRGETAR